MTEGVLIPITIAGELAFYLLTGLLMPFRKKAEAYSVIETMCAGWLISTAMFEIAVFVMQLIRIPLLPFAVFWTALCSLACAVSLVLRSRYFFAGLDYDIKMNGASLALILFLFCAGAFALYSVILPVGTDPGWVIASMTQDLYHDSVGLYAAGTGEPVLTVKPHDFFARGYVFDEIVCLITGLHPMTQMRIVRTVVTVFLSEMTVYRILMRVFSGNRTRAAGGGILYLLVSLFFQTPFTPSGLLLSAGWTGNAAFAGLMLPALLLLSAAYLENPENVRVHILIFTAGIAAVSLSPQAIYLYPAALVCVMLPSMAAGKDALGIFRLILWLAVPAAVFMAGLILPFVQMQQ